LAHIYLACIYLHLAGNVESDKLGKSWKGYLVKTWQRQGYNK